TLAHSAGTVAVTNGMVVTAAELADLTFTSALNDSTNSSFSYTVNDADVGVTSAVMNITVTAVNDVPVATGNTVVASEDVPLVIDASDFNYTDTEGDALASVTITGLNLNGGTLSHSAGATSVTNGMTVTAAELADLTFTSALNDSTNSSFSYTVNDADVGVTSATMNITVNAVNDVPVESTIEAAVLVYTENDGAVEITSALTLNDIDDTDLESAIVRITVGYANGEDVLTFADQNGISGSWNATTGEMTLTGSATVAHYETALRSITFTNSSENPSTLLRTASFTVNDGDADSDTQTRDVSIANVNDTPTGTVTIDNTTPEEDDLLTTNNTLVDEEGLGTISYQWQRFTVDIMGATGSTYTTLQVDVGTAIRVVASYTDEQGTPESVPSMVTALVMNVDDPAVISGDISISGDEGEAFSGILTATDVDGLSDSSIFTINTAGTNGLATIDPASGAWNYSPTDANWFGRDSFTVTVTDDLGGTTTQIVTVTLANVNDAAIITGVDNVAVTENIGLTDNVIVMSGGLTIDDIDVGESSFQPTTITGVYGNFVIEASGEWVYTAENNQAGIQQLDEGQTLTETLTVFSFDGTTHTVQIDIVGTEDAPVISGVFEGVVTRDAALTYSNSLSISDVDVNDNPISFADEANTLGDNEFGHFTLTLGVWTYTLDSVHPAVRALLFTEVLNDTHTFWASDGSSQIVSVVIQGPSEEPQVAAALAGTPSPIDAVDITINNGKAKEFSYEWLADIAAIITTSELEESISSSTVDITGSVDVPKSLINYNPIQIYRDEVTQAVEAEQIVVRHLEYKPPPPIEDLLALNLVMAPVLGLDLADQYDGLVAEKSSKDNLRRATQSMREQMNESVNVERHSEKVTDLVLRVSGITLSAGSLAWLLHGGSLFASALSSIPTWQGIDPLPVLAKKHKSRLWRSKDPKGLEITMEEEEVVAGHILDSVKTVNTAESQRSRERDL
ncbi:MAG: VCBS repeat-containing protein, partial [Granulosicoccus sp.]